MMFGAVTGTVDAEYTAGDLVDGNPWNPVRRTGAASFCVTPTAARTIGLLAICNHNLPAATVVTFGGQISGTVTVPAAGADRIPNQPFTTIASVTNVTSITVSVGSLSNASVIGEAWSSTLHALPKQLRVPFDWDRSKPFEWEGAPPYDVGEADPWRVSGQILLNATQLADVQAWSESTRRGSLPSLIVLDESVNDARLVKFQFTPKPTYLDKFMVTFEFVEVLPRLRWP